jgi:uncharacterized protein with gpF-like domain
LERFIVGQEARVKDAFGAFISNVKSQRVTSQVVDLLERRDVEGALRVVDTYVVRLAAIVPRIFQATAEDESDQLAEQLAGRGGAAISFDPTYPRAAQLMRQNRLQFLTGFSREQKDATRLALANALQEGVGIQGASRAFRDSVGLTERQEAAAQNYARLLREGSSEALARDLRDRRFDPSVRRAVRTGEPLSDAQVERMETRYRERFVASRAETIARTETTRVVSLARREAVQQAADDIGIVGSDIVRVWNATQDARTRDSHAAMDGQEVGQDEPFISGDGNRIMFPGDPSAPPEDTINCRCVVTIRILEREERRAA